MTFETTFISLNDGTQICAPAQENLMTNFVLREQGDWFEDEIHFVRKLLSPGMKALDIGANYGLYSTAIAKAIGDKGKLWCFEPTPNTASALKQTLKQNQLEDFVEVIEQGLSDHQGTATFYLSDNAELNSLSGSPETAKSSLTIELNTLDHCQQQYGWKQLDFIKLDAEGEESKILKQATQTLATCSPVIMFELKHGDHVNHQLISEFSDLGFDPFYLIPGLNVLAPFNANSPHDPYLLNLFCCKSATADELESKGLLVRQIQASPSFISEKQMALFFKDIKTPSVTLSRKINDEYYSNILSAYVSSRHKELSASMRLQNLSYAFSHVQQALQKGESKLDRLATYARICFDIGQRNVGIQICDYVIKKYLQQGQAVSITEPYIPLNLNFERIDNKENEAAYLLASFVDEYICKHAFSCYFTGAQMRPYFNLLGQLGYKTEKMAKREQALLSSFKIKE